MQIKYDAAHPLTYGYWVCEKCKSNFYGGGPARHNTGCTETGYSACAYHFGPNEKTNWIGAVITEEQKTKEAANA
jgi:hypothetical protein